MGDSACTNLPASNCIQGAGEMGVDRAVERKNKREELAKLKDAALTELERRGYEVRGKTPAQIRELLKRRPNKSASVKLRVQNELRPRRT